MYINNSTTCSYIYSIIYYVCREGRLRFFYLKPNQEDFFELYFILVYNNKNMKQISLVRSHVHRETTFQRIVPTTHFSSPMSMHMVDVVHKTKRRILVRLSAIIIIL